MSGAFVAVITLALVAPHLLQLRSIAPLTAASIWLSSLIVRAGIVVFIGIAAVTLLPRTGAFDRLAEICLHAVTPFFRSHIEISGHPIVDGAVALPLAIVALVAMRHLIRVAKVHRATKQVVARNITGGGMDGATIVHDDSPWLGVIGLVRGQVVVSDAALSCMDEAELSAGMAHEMAHVRRGHKPLLLVASILAAISRGLPGTSMAEKEFAFALERDADEYAVRRTRNPLALAGAICKAADQRPTLAIAALRGQGQIMQRLDALMDGGRQRTSGIVEVGHVAVALAVGGAAIWLGIAIPSLLARVGSTALTHLLATCV